MHSLIGIIIVLAIVGVALYLFNLFVTMDQRFKTAINVLVCLVAFLYIVSLFGFFPIGH